MSSFYFSSSALKNKIINVKFNWFYRGGVQRSQLELLTAFLFSSAVPYLRGFNTTCSFVFTPMTKKKSSKMTPTSQLQENIVVEEEKPSSVPKKPGSEIDEIFAGKKRKKSQKKKTEKADENVSKRPDETKKKNKKKIKGSNDREFVDTPARPRKRTADGLAVYTEEELGFTKADAGGTPLCPFDCSCCF